jgi:hypothetical protein
MSENSVSQFTFRYPEWHEIEPRAWVDYWASRYDGEDNDKYYELIKKEGRLSSEDFELVGLWKEGLKSVNGRWKSSTPVGFDVWEQAVKETPQCPEESGVTKFLDNWSKRTFVAGKKSGLDLRYSFGLSRATTLLHFISGGEYPILDARVATAMTRLGSSVTETIVGYPAFCSRFSEIATVCGVSGTEGLRKLDNALFSYGLFPKSFIR